MGRGNSVKYKNIQVSTETYEKLSRLKTEIEAIFKSKVSFEKVILLLLTTRVDWDELIR